MPGGRRLLELGDQLLAHFEQLALVPVDRLEGDRCGSLHHQISELSVHHANQILPGAVGVCRRGGGLPEGQEPRVKVGRGDAPLSTVSGRGAVLGQVPGFELVHGTGHRVRPHHGAQRVARLALAARLDAKLGAGVGDGVESLRVAQVEVLVQDGLPAVVVGLVRVEVRALDVGLCPPHEVHHWVRIARRCQKLNTPVREPLHHVVYGEELLLLDGEAEHRGVGQQRHARRQAAQHAPPAQQLGPAQPRHGEARRGLVLEDGHQHAPEHLGLVVHRERRLRRGRPVHPQGAADDPRGPLLVAQLLRPVCAAVLAPFVLYTSVGFHRLQDRGVGHGRLFFQGRLRPALRRRRLVLRWQRPHAHLGEKQVDPARAAGAEAAHVLFVEDDGGRGERDDEEIVHHDANGGVDAKGGDGHDGADGGGDEGGGGGERGVKHGLHRTAVRVRHAPVPPTIKGLVRPARHVERRLSMRGARVSARDAFGKRGGGQERTKNV
mmetsp:Transcript_12945/g.30537  ORF Transcript_12945/g.30537 Transcript_12945/m.30537 type:complete len:493 (-) Transcript_12945:1606-3084(-)